MKKDNKKAIKTYIIDANEKVLGRLATKATNLLRGRESADFTPNIVCGDKVVVINAKDIRVTGNKAEDKKYYHYSGYPGGMRTKTYKDIIKKDPAWIIRTAVYGMLPKNKLRSIFIKNLEIFADDSYVAKEGDIKI